MAVMGILGEKWGAYSNNVELRYCHPWLTHLSKRLRRRQMPTLSAYLKGRIVLPCATVDYAPTVAHASPSRAAAVQAICHNIRENTRW